MIDSGEINAAENMLLDSIDITTLFEMSEQMCIRDRSDACKYIHASCADAVV